MEEESEREMERGLCGFVLESCGLNEWRRMNVCGDARQRECRSGEIVGNREASAVRLWLLFAVTRLRHRATPPLRPYSCKAVSHMTHQLRSALRLALARALTHAASLSTHTPPLPPCHSLSRHPHHLIIEWGLGAWRCAPQAFTGGPLSIFSSASSSSCPVLLARIGIEFRDRLSRVDVEPRRER